MPLAIDVAGTYVITATIRVENGHEIAVDSDPLIVEIGPPALIRFRQMLGPAHALTDHCPFPLQPVVEIRDAGGNMVVGRSGDEAVVTIHIRTGPDGGAFRNLRRSTSMRASMGVGNFSARNYEPLLLTRYVLVG
jgi:hypothetical protein